MFVCIILLYMFICCFRSAGSLTAPGGANPATTLIILTINIYIYIYILYMLYIYIYIYYIYYIYIYT